MLSSEDTTHISPMSLSEFMHLQYNSKSIFDCCIQGDLPTAVLLWQQGHRQYDIVNKEDQSGFPPLHWASYNARIPVLRFLILKGYIYMGIYIEGVCYV